jgi:hypothetical protein
MDIITAVFHVKINVAKTFLFTIYEEVIKTFFSGYFGVSCGCFLQAILPIS